MHIRVALIDLFEAVVPSDQLVEVESTLPIKFEHEWDVLGRVRSPEQGTLNPLLEQGEQRRRDGDSELIPFADAGHDTGPALADGVNPFGNVGAARDPHAHNARGRAD